MFFPEALYLLSARDQQVTWLDPSSSRLQQLAAGLSLTLDLVHVPDDRVLLLQNATIVATGGAGQQVTSRQFQLIPPVGVPSVLLHGNWDVVGAGLSAQTTWTGQMLVPPGWTLRGAATYSAAAVNNIIDCSHIGIFIPVGNIQRV